MRSLFGQIKPEVERPNLGNQVGRPLLIGLIVLPFLNIIAALGVIVTALLIGPLAGFYLTVAIAVYAVRVNSWWPFSIDWNTRGRQHSHTVRAAFALALALLALHLAGHWPTLADPSEHRWLWWHWQLDAGRVYWQTPGAWVELRWLQWARLALIVIIPTTLPRALQLLRYRFHTSIVYPTWDDSVNAQGRRFRDPLGLLDIDNSAPPAPDIPTTSVPHSGGAL
jgi:hypothetical protein